jgi:adenosylmethionine-8-amino-7-oxononanoate aminotransferase
MNYYSFQFLNPLSQYTAAGAMPVAAHGVTITYADGHEALCGTSGVWNASLGYGNEAIADALHKAARDASFLGQFRTSNSYAEQAAVALLGTTTGDYSRVLFATSGSAAVDASLKIARVMATLRGEPRRRLIVSIRGSYHGMTLAAMGIAGQDLGQRLAGVQQTDTRLIDSDGASSMTSLIEASGQRIAAVIIEPVLGSGTRPVSEEVIKAVLDGRRQHDYIVIADEVATGFGRTGPMFASDLWPASPDILITSKALTNGTMAASALLWSQRLVEIFDQADIPLFHAETQAGSPIPSAAILATIAEHRRLDVLRQGHRTSTALEAWLDHMTADLPGSRHFGVGCFRTLQLVDTSGNSMTPARVAKLVETCRRAGATVYPGPSGIQFVPALTYDPQEFERYLGIIEDTLRASEFACEQLLQAA